MTPYLITHDLSIGYRRADRIIASHLNLALASGELVCVLGANGAGKSTLMRTLAGMQPPLHGEVRIDQVSIARLAPADLARKISLVLTDRIDVGLLTARDVVALGRHPYTDWAGRMRPEDHAAVERALDGVGAAHLADRHVHHLSDGERQKIMIARALAQDTPLIILDEPTAFLDLPRRAEIMSVLRRLAHDMGRAVLLTTHDLELAVRNADHVWLFGGDQQIAVGAPEDLILSGAFAAAFDSGGIHFHPETGAFTISGGVRGAIRVIGAGVRALWTERALERAGYAIVSHAEDVVEVTENGLWRGMICGKQRDVRSLDELVRWVRSVGERVPT